MTFSVIDKRTGKAPIFDHNHIFKEKWFKNSGLIYCDIDGWYIGEDGGLVLIDDCGNAGYPPIDRFEVVFDEEPKQGKWIYEGVCSICGERCDYHLSGTIWIDSPANYCPNCGARMKEGETE